VIPQSRITSHAALMPDYSDLHRQTAPTLPLGKYSSLILLRVAGWVGLCGQLHAKRVYPRMVTHLSAHQAQRREIVYLWDVITMRSNSKRIVKWRAINPAEAKSDSEFHFRCAYSKNKMQ